MYMYIYKWTVYFFTNLSFVLKKCTKNYATKKPQFLLVAFFQKKAFVCLNNKISQVGLATSTDSSKSDSLIRSQLC